MTQNRFVCEWVTKGCEKIENQKDIETELLGQRNLKTPFRQLQKIRNFLGSSEMF